MEVFPFLVFVFDVRLGLGRCCCCSGCCSSSGLLVEVNYRVEAIGCYSVVVFCVLPSTYFPLSVQTLSFLFLTLLFLLPALLVTPYKNVYFYTGSLTTFGWGVVGGVGRVMTFVVICKQR